MHRRLPFLFLLILAAGAIAAPSDRETALHRIQNEALVAKLLEQSAADLKAHDYAAALKKAEAAEALQPGNSIILNTKGAALTELKRYDEASLALDAALAADPTAFAPQFNQGEILALQKKYSDAAVQFSILQSRFGPLPLIKYKLYLCYALSGQKDRATAARLALRYPEDGPAWYFAQAVDRLQSGDRRTALRLIAAAEAIHDEDASTYRDSLRESNLLK